MRDVRTQRSQNVEGIGERFKEGEERGKSLPRPGRKTSEKPTKRRQEGGVGEDDKGGENWSEKEKE